MKKITSMVFTIILVLSVMAVSVHAVEVPETLEQEESVTSTDQRILAQFENTRINSYKTVTVTPNKGWGLWLILSPVAGEDCTISVYENVGSVQVLRASYNLKVGEKINKKVINSCSGNSYVVEFFSSGITYIAGGINQTERT